MKSAPSPVPAPNGLLLDLSPYQQGMALIEALVASLVLAIGLTAATRLTLHTLYIASETRQHTVGLALALDAMD